MFYILVFDREGHILSFGLCSIKVKSSNWTAVSVNRSDWQSKSHSIPKSCLTVHENKPVEALPPMGGCMVWWVGRGVGFWVG